jgi:hypothetical protein
MITAAEQYRALVAKLESINPSVVSEAPEDDAAAAQAANGVNAAGQNVTMPNGVNPETGPAPAAAPAPAADPNAIQTIEAPTFNQAYAKAKALKLKKFKWCGVYAVKDAVRPPPVQPKPSAPRGGTAINDINPNGSYVGQIGLDSQTPSYSPNSAE